MFLSNMRDSQRDYSANLKENNPFFNKECQILGFVVYREIPGNEIVEETPITPWLLEGNEESIGLNIDLSLY